MCDSNMIRDDAMLEQLRCSLCTEYLSCAPIQVLPDGSSICGNCKPPGSEKAGYRSLGYEALLNKFSFPCKYQSYGCEERLVFGEVTKHNSTCEYQAFRCPSGECLWKGPTWLVSKHFIDIHPNQVLEQLKFTLNIAENKEEIAVFVREGFNFIMKYKYNAATCEFYHDLRYFKSVKEASYKIQFINSSNDNVIEGYQCGAYSYDIVNPLVSNKLKIDEVLPYLKEPHQIIIAIDLSFTHDLLKCEKCKNYLAIPIFESAECHICGNCWERGMEQTTNKDLVQHVANSIIPCCWENCKTVARGDKIREHEKSCKKRIYRCIIPDCNDSFGPCKIDSHMQTHLGYQNALDEDNRMAFFNDGDYYFYATIENEIVVLKMKGGCSDVDKKNRIQTITVKTTEYMNKSRIAIFFYHYSRDMYCSHCRNKPSKFDFKLTDEIKVDRYKMCSDCWNGYSIDIKIE